jgi:c-di-AMP phosphodiesterase-like protein
MDVIGASIGIMKAAKLYNVNSYIVLDGTNPSIERMMNEVMQDDTLAKGFIRSEHAQQMMTEHTLLVVVDTHKASMTIEPWLVHRATRVVVIDHHRRGEEFIKDAVLIYLEPYASSASELVTEVLQYIDERLVLRSLEATLLLAGMVVDTKHFMMHTGSRTFEAAGFLRRQGADPMLIQNVLKEDLPDFVAKSELAKRAQTVLPGVALSVAHPDEEVSQLLIAQAADLLLEMSGIEASFVIARRPDGRIGISARSLGTRNVQLVMEKLGGGGHLGNAAVQLSCTLDEAYTRLMQALTETDEEEK